ncbi:nucleotidyltransferase family protein [Sphingomonas sp.]|uniref:nucleotidyltransferase domain-containing protein n=1 Tax=Sphingomonas sp. TaxID=28214 RepID=UPI002C9C588D|nr:nucleotidyltransferase family protein [Sphingomonas sp.]HTG38000.1 nucleotidyltransferase family protein [Sphingomonas sp.]
MTARLLVAALRDPSSVTSLDAGSWTSLIAAARAEQMAGTLACRVQGLPMPGAVAAILADASASAEQGRIAALWEAEMARRALAPLGIPVILLKGTAFVAAGLSAGAGRHIGDLDILVPHASLDAAEEALIAAGWEWVKPDPYDDAYYRRWMHELPPMIHRERDRMIDVHHTILPLTARPRPHADALIAARTELRDGIAMLGREDVIVHAVAHLLADGDLAGGLRNLWDIHCLLADFDAPDFRERLRVRAAYHGLAPHMDRAIRLAAALYDDGAALTPIDWLFMRRLLGRDGWGRQRRKLTEFAFYLRGHWLRMPPAMLARHLWTKWRKGYRPVG